jgi:hypothetical protein|tara:strand:- start:4748 stop:5071 length:324 start_codon:yes stop_codon:yes gene_type:complete
MRQAIADEALRRKIKDGALVKMAVEDYFNGAPDVPVEVPNPCMVEGGTPDITPPEPTLANTEEGFKLGVEAACEKVSKNVRLGVKMATGISMGEDIAKRIRLDLLGG